MENDFNGLLGQTAKKILERASENGTINENELIILLMYYKETHKTPNPIDELMGYGKQLSGIINKVFPITGGSK